MSSLLNDGFDLLRLGILQRVLALLLTAAAGALAARGISRWFGRRVERWSDTGWGTMARTLVFYGIVFVVFTLLLRGLGVRSWALFASAGAVGVAVGFAARTTLSSLISGLFLLCERPFDSADVIRVRDRYGRVTDTGVFSTTLRTVDNLALRIPNETLFQNDFIVLSRYEIRRVDVVATIQFADDVRRAREVLLETAVSHQRVLGDPRPQTLVQRMAPEGVELVLRCWLHREQFFAPISAVTEDVRRALREAGCTIPRGNRSVYLREESRWETVRRLENSAETTDG